VRQGRHRRGGERLLGLVAALCAMAEWSCGFAHGQTASSEAQISAWASGGTSTTVKPDDKDGTPGAGVAPAAVPVWQATALPTAVIQGGAIPPGWQPQAVPYQGIGPDGRPMTMYVAPTYVFTYQSGPPVLAVPTVNRGPARAAPQASPAGWNYATSGAPPVNTALPPATVARYQPTPYQFPTDSRALTGTPITPPASAAPAPPPQTWGAAPAAQPAASPPVEPPTTTVDAPPSQWVTSDVRLPDSAATAALAATAAPAVAAATDTPAMAAVPGPSPTAADSGMTPAQPVSSNGLSATQPAASRAANAHVWRVVGVQDGDTLTCLDETNQQQKIRLAGIDAPEVGQDYGTAAREALASMVFGKTVDVVDEGRDRYGRWVGHVSVDGLDVNRQMVGTGSAWHYAAYSTDQSLAAVQAQAQSQRLGLWGQPNPIPPWEYRLNATKQ
jgi:endonuclease YncB( thermonuclease family)